MALVESGWLIEGFTGDPSRSIGAIGLGCGKPGWTNFDEALRFARKQDAEQFARVYLPKNLKITWEAVDHGWYDK